MAFCSSCYTGDGNYLLNTCTLLTQQSNCLGAQIQTKHQSGGILGHVVQEHRHFYIYICSEILFNICKTKVNEHEINKYANVFFDLCGEKRD